MAAPGLDLLHLHIGPDLAELKDACLQMLDIGKEFVILDPHAGDSELVAMMKDVVETLAQRTGREIKWERGPGQRTARSKPGVTSTGQGGRASRSTTARVNTPRLLLHSNISGTSHSM
eukprot:378785-Prymnesium_polylepis.1